jgi:serine/threonine protein kinase
LDYFVEEANMYLVMEYVKGKDLAKLIENHPSHRIDVKVGIKWMRKVLEILKYLHNQTPPIIHRDIKPSNLMLTPEGEIFMLDFGIARTISPESASHTSVGTFGYASPEQFSGRAVQTSDVFSTGATFHHLLSGESPTERDPFDFPPLAKYRDDVPPALNDLISRMVKQRKEDRPQSVEEVLFALSQIRETNVMPTPSGPDIVVPSGSGSLPGAPTNKMSEAAIPTPPPVQPPQIKPGVRPIAAAGSASLQKPVPPVQSKPGSGSFQPPPPQVQRGTGGMQAPPPQQRGTGGIQPPPPVVRPAAVPGSSGNLQQSVPITPYSDKNTGMPPMQRGQQQPPAGKQPMSTLKILLIIGGVLLLLGGGFVAMVVWLAMQAPSVDSGKNKVKININSQSSPSVSSLPVDTSNEGTVSKADLALIEQGFDDGTVQGDDAIIAAVTGNNQQFAKKLISKGVDINKVSNGITPLIAAITSDQPEMVDFLLTNGADPDVKGMNGWAALHYAVSVDKPEIVKILMNHGADSGIKEDNGATPLDLAKAQENKELLDALGAGK